MPESEPDPHRARRIAQLRLELALIKAIPKGARIEDVVIVLGRLALKFKERVPVKED